MDIATIIKNTVIKATAKWAKQRRREEREANAIYNRRQALSPSHRVTLKEAAAAVMESAYRRAAGSVGMANPRQIYYQARPPILERTGRTRLGGPYFSQTLLVEFMLENAETTKHWDIIWDDRGHFQEPHTGKVIGLGTLAVREYLQHSANEVDDDLGIIADAADFPTNGPRHRFQAILFIEKEGFLPIFEAVHLAERFDLAIMSSKGLSTTAARMLVDRLCGEHGIPLLVLHDFDKVGFSILGTLRRNNRRFKFTNKIEVIDLGVRLSDVQRHQLESEPVRYRKSNPSDNLRRNGATQAEIDFLCSQRVYEHYAGRRVELNAFSSDSLIQWIESKLKRHGIKKVVPDVATLESAYRRAAVIGKMPEWIAEQIKTVNVPSGLLGKVQRMLRENPKLSWDAAIAEVAEDDF